MANHLRGRSLDPRPEGWHLAQEILRYPALLNLRTRRLVADCRERFGIGEHQAMRGIGLARKLAKLSA